MEFRGQHGYAGIAVETVLSTKRGREESDQEDVALAHPVLLQHSDGCDHRSTTL